MRFARGARMLRGVAPRFKMALFRALGATAVMGGPRGAGALGAAAPALAGAREALWGFLGGALSADEKSRLGVALYDAGDEYRSEPRFAWEDAWLDRRLPRAPARVLVGAAGAGREARALLDRGLDVVALEPSAALAALCRERTKARVIEARYEDILLAGERFEAVLLGLGSLSHVLDPGARRRLMAALAEACPAGPILVSALAAPARARREPGRGARLGRAIARPIRAARRLPDVEAGEVVFGELGFARLFDREELAALAGSIGRDAIFDDDVGAPDGLLLCAFVSA